MGFGHVDERVVVVIVLDAPGSGRVAEMAAANIVLQIRPPGSARGCDLVENICPVDSTRRRAAVPCTRS